MKHLVFSSLEDVRRLLPKGALPEVAPGRIVPVFESKAEVEVTLNPVRGGQLNRCQIAGFLGTGRQASS